MSTLICGRDLKREYAGEALRGVIGLPSEKSQHCTGCRRRVRNHRVDVLLNRRVEARAPLWYRQLAHSSIASLSILFRNTSAVVHYAKNVVLSNYTGFMFTNLNLAGKYCQHSQFITSQGMLKQSTRLVNATRSRFRVGDQSH